MTRKRKGESGSDEMLLATLAAAGSTVSSDELDEVLAGVAAAPPGHNPLAWTVLVAAAAGSDLKDQLRSAHDRAVAARNDGLDRAGMDPARLAALRAELARLGLDGFIVPRGDEHLGEYVPRRAERLAWLTGFTGTAGTAVVLGERAVLFVDGRYTLEAEAQVDGALIERKHLIETPPEGWLASNLAKDQKLGYDPWLHTEKEIKDLARACTNAGAELIAVDANPIDRIWQNQPPPPIAPVVAHDESFAGESSAAKRARLADKIAELAADTAVVIKPDSLAWLLNVRGGDVPFTPLALGFALADASGRVEVFMDPRTLAPGLAGWLGNEVTVRPRDAFDEALDRLGSEDRKVLVDPAGAPARVFTRLRNAGAKLVEGADPCVRMKACKNEGELGGARAAHRRDGVAMARFLAWIGREAPQGALTEMGAVERLEALRAEDALFRGPAFATIAGAGPNGAIVHYRVSERTNRRLETGSLFLIDSGGQYLDGTTDVTRTLAVGEPSAEMRERFTRVLRGNIALATLAFPKGTVGAQIDAIARRHLWDAGLDYDHGTGHGVGSYLGVHEGPQRIAKVYQKVPLEHGMIVSEEPGYYKAGAYGIRTENLLVVRERPMAEGAERAMLAFEVLTLVPIDLSLVEAALLDAEEIAWLNAYHARVAEEIGPSLDSETRAWLERATRAL